MIQYNFTTHEALNRDNLSKKCFHATPSILKKTQFWNESFFFKYHFYKQPQAEIGKKQAKAK